MLCGIRELGATSQGNPNSETATVVSTVPDHVDNKIS